MCEKYRDRTTALKLAVLLLSAFCAGWLCSRSALPAAPSPTAPPPDVVVAPCPAVPADPLSAVAPPAAPPPPPAAPAAAPAAAPLLLADEAQFAATLRSCLGAQCLTAVPERAKAPRVVLLAPPGAVGDALAALARRAVARDKGAKVELVVGGAAPPYGYGKNHGWTRIVRVALPLRHALADLPPPRAGGPRDAAAAAAALRQLVRWHCRVSHVAAHTALLTVHARGVVAAPRTELEALLTFIGVKVTPDALDDEERRGLGELRAAVERAAALADAAPSTDAALLEHALRDELTATRTLRKWPCQSLWVEGGDDQLARALVPNCSAPFTVCSVGRDRCETAATRAGACDG